LYENWLYPGLEAEVKRSMYARWPSEFTTFEHWKSPQDAVSQALNGCATHASRQVLTHPVFLLQPAM
jgi:hypothetical protein